MWLAKAKKSILDLPRVGYRNYAIKEGNTYQIFKPSKMFGENCPSYFRRKPRKFHFAFDYQKMINYIGIIDLF